MLRDKLKTVARNDSVFFFVYMFFFLRDFEDNLINHVSPEDWRHLEKLKEV